MNPTMNKLACQAIERYYHDKGRPFAQVRLLGGENSTDEHVIFEIMEGPAVKVWDTKFEGHTFESGAVLRTHLVTSRAFLGLLGGQYQESMVLEDKNRLEEYYKSFGYDAVRVDVELVPDDKQEYVTLIYHIQEGMRFRVTRSQVVATGAAARFQPEMEQQLRLRNGDYYNGLESRESMQDMQDYVGYPGFKLAVHEVPIYGGADQPGTKSLLYEVQDCRPEADHVGNIYIIGNTRTRENVIRRQLRVYPG